MTTGIKQAVSKKDDEKNGFVDGAIKARSQTRSRTQSAAILITK